MKEKSRRDVELILLGVLLCKSERQEVLDQLPRSSYTKEIDPLVDSIRTNDATILLGWLAGKAVMPSEGETIINALTKAIEVDNADRVVRDVCRSLEFAARIEKKDEILERLRRAVAKLESL